MMRKIIRYVVLIGNIKTRTPNDIELEEHHCADIPESLTVENDLMRDLLLIFSDCQKVQFTKGGIRETLRGQWYLQCK